MKTLIIGGGLSGLALAEALESAGQDYHLLEARSRFGGRIMSQEVGGADFDLGPAWFWPGQPRMAALMTRLGLQKFDQFAQGDLLFEDAQQRVQRGRGGGTMQGSWRVSGGLAKLTDALCDRLPEHRKSTDAHVETIARADDACIATLTTGEAFSAEQIVLALPQRIAAKIVFAPTLPAEAMRAMGDTATWMAGQAKAVAIYDTAFWREDGLSGDAMSRHGPMVEIHDASPADGGPFAVFGFIGVQPNARTDPDQLRTEILAQLGRLFGPQATTPTQLLIKDWAMDPQTATNADHAPLYRHPTYGLPPALQHLWGGKLHFAGTEVAPEFGGYLEGALEAAETVLDTLLTSQTAP